MKTYGYARVSTVTQKLQRQIDNIREAYPDAIILTEKYTGTTTDRPVFNKLVKQLKPGDTVVFDEVSRMARNADEGYALYQKLYTDGINLIFLKEPHLNTSVFREAMQDKVPMTGTDVDVILDAVNKYMMLLAQKQIQVAFQTAEHEVDFLHKRVREGVHKAQERYAQEELEGVPHTKKKVGREKGSSSETKKAKAAKEIIRKHSKDFGGSLNDIDTRQLCGCSRNSYYKYKREVAAALN